MSARLLEIRALAWRAFLHTRRSPVVVVAGLFQPIIWLVLFSAVFKNSPLRELAGSGSYLAFITPGALVFTAFSGALNGGVPILFDRELGFLDRLLTAPLISRMSIIWAAGFHIFVMTLIQCAAIMILTALMGVPFRGGAMGLAALIAALALICLLFTTLSLALAFMLRRHFELISLIMIVSLPMVFISTAFAPVAYMPGWLAVPVALNPITFAVEPLRAVFFNPDWSWTAPIFEAPYADVSLLGCLGALAALNVLAALAARSVIRKKLN